MYINLYNMARILRINKLQTIFFLINERFERREVNTLKEITSQTDQQLTSLSSKTYV